MQAAFEQGAHVAMWKQPHLKEWTLIISLKGQKKLPSLQAVLGGEKGFVFSPFNHIEKSGECVFISDDARLVKAEQGYSLSWRNSVDQELKALFEESLSRHLIEKKLCFFCDNSKGIPDAKEGKEHFVRLVKDAVGKIKNGKFHKVVTARKVTRKVSSSLNFSYLFDRLSTIYAEAFVSLVSLPEEGIWVGASPEILFELEQGRFGKTVSLAGTVRRESYRAGTSMAIWGEKEIQEHALVSQFIRKTLAQEGILSFKESQTVSHSIAHLFHLRKDFDFDVMHPANNICDIESLIYGLHPTPAICGLPKKAALEFILNRENFDRSFYGGFLGPVNIGGVISLYVNIRCMNIRGDIAELYAGAGITEDSLPRDEWEETNTKLRMMIDMLEDEVQCLAQ